MKKRNKIVSIIKSEMDYKSDFKSQITDYYNQLIDQIDQKSKQLVDQGLDDWEKVK